MGYHHTPQPSKAKSVGLTVFVMLAVGFGFFNYFEAAQYKAAHSACMAALEKIAE